MYGQTVRSFLFCIYMSVMQEKLSLSSLNCRGLADGRKRRAVFQWLKTYHQGIILLQETHSTTLGEKLWLDEWGCEIYFSHGSNNARGVAILFPKGMHCNIQTSVIDDEGRYIVLDIITDEWKMLLCNVYAPTKDKPSEQSVFFNKIFNVLADFEDKNIVIGGDFNICLNPCIDKSGGEVESQSKIAHLIMNYSEELNLNYIWHTTNPELKRYSRRGNTKLGVQGYD